MDAFLLGHVVLYGSTHGLVIAVACLRFENKVQNSAIHLFEKTLK